MLITEEQIKQMLRFDETSRRLLDMLASLEIDRLAQLIASVVRDSGQNQQTVRQSITDALEESKDIFGNVNLAQKLNLDDLLKRIYQK